MSAKITAAIGRRNYKFDSADGLECISVDGGQVSRGEGLQLRLPTVVCDLHAQNAVDELERPGALRHGRATDNRPGHQRGLRRRRLTQRLRDNSLKIRTSPFQILFLKMLGEPRINFIILEADQGSTQAGNSRRTKSRAASLEGSFPSS